MKPPARRVLGIDPGLGGALVLLRPAQSAVVIDMPTCSRGKKGARQVDAAQLFARLFAELDQALFTGEPLEAWVEQVGPMPGQGVVSMFQFGEGCGVIRGVLAALEISTSFVSPVRWKSQLGLRGRDKDYALTRAKELMPDMVPHLTKKAHVGRADAALIAYYGLKTYVE